MNDQEHAKFMETVASKAKAISYDTFQSYWLYGSLMDPDRTGYEGEDNYGRVWWIYDPDDDSVPIGERAVTAWDFLSAHPEIDREIFWTDVYARENEGCRSATEPWRRPLRLGRARRWATTVRGVFTYPLAAARPLRY